VIEGYRHAVGAPNRHALNDAMCLVILFLRFSRNDVNANRERIVAALHNASETIGRVAWLLAVPARLQLVLDRFIDVIGDSAPVNSQIDIDRPNVIPLSKKQRRYPTTDDNQVLSLFAEYGQHFNHDGFAGTDCAVIIFV
jgi:hypothetical protein